MYSARPHTTSPPPDANDPSAAWPQSNISHLFAPSQSLFPPTQGGYMFDQHPRSRNGPSPYGSNYQTSSQPQNTPQTVSQPPLLLNNLAQHLNNPPAPTAYGTTTTPQAGGKMLLLPNGAPPPTGSEEEKIYILITELLDPETRETALLELSKKREMYEDLALVLWGGFGELLDWL